MTIKKFAGIVDGDVFTIIHIDSDFKGSDGMAGQRIIAGYLSEPKFVEIPDNSEIDHTWT
jgi:hypothetical protein